MDSTLTPAPPPDPTHPPSVSKFPIKRKPRHNPNHNPNPNFKFHRVWTEPDELLFLRSLISTSSSLRLSFPRGLPVFYSHFLSSSSSSLLSHPYSKSQLYEKIRRLRKKFRVTSSRLARGLDLSALSSHDRALFDLSQRLWSPQYASSSPFFSGDSHDSHGNDKSDDSKVDGFDDDEDEDGNCDLKDVNVGYDFGEERDGVVVGGPRRNLIGDLVARSAIDALDLSLKEVRAAAEKDSNRDAANGKGCAVGYSGKSREDFSKRWKELEWEELDVFGRRLRLLLEGTYTRK